MRELLIGFDDCFLSFLKRKTLLSKHKKNFRFCSKVLLKCRKGHFRTPKFQKYLGEAECFGYALTCQSLRPWPFKPWFCPQPLLSNMFHRHWCRWSQNSLFEEIWFTFKHSFARKKYFEKVIFSWNYWIMEPFASLYTSKCKFNWLF